MVGDQFASFDLVADGTPGQREEPHFRAKQFDDWLTVDFGPKVEF